MCYSTSLALAWTTPPGFIFCHSQAIDVSGAHGLLNKMDKTAVAFVFTPGGSTNGLKLDASRPRAGNLGCIPNFGFGGYGLGTLCSEKHTVMAPAVYHPDGKNGRKK